MVHHLPFVFLIDDAVHELTEAKGQEKSESDAPLDEGILGHDEALFRTLLDVEVIDLLVRFAFGKLLKLFRLRNTLSCQR